MNDLIDENPTAVAPVAKGGVPFTKATAGKQPRTGLKSASGAMALLAKNAPGIARTVVKLAKQGDMTAAKVALQFALPKTRTLNFDIPVGLGLADIAKVFDAILVAVGTGKISVDEAAAIAGILEKQAKIIESSEVLDRLAKLEAIAGSRSAA